MNIYAKKICNCFDFTMTEFVEQRLEVKFWAENDISYTEAFKILQRAFVRVFLIPYAYLHRRDVLVIINEKINVISAK